MSDTPDSISVDTVEELDAILRTTSLTTDAEVAVTYQGDYILADEEGRNYLVRAEVVNERPVSPLENERVGYRQQQHGSGA